jgi:hypothetical protein
MLMGQLNKTIQESDHWAIGQTPEVLANIYNAKTNIAIWQRHIPSALQQYVQCLLKAEHKIALKLNAPCEQVVQELERILPVNLNNADSLTVNLVDARQAFITDISMLLEMFTCLFESSHVGVRMNTLERAMCPRFHVDHVPARLVTTYSGAGTQWLPEHFANRQGLGKPTTEAPCEIVKDENGIAQLNPGDVALLKGERWEGNEGRGLIHRSPNEASEQNTRQHWRLLITLDLGSL